MRALLCPASLKGVLSARAAAAALARGVRESGGEAVELPVADGGEGTAEALERGARRRVARGGGLRSARPARAGRAGSSCRTAAQSSRRPPRSDCRCWRRPSATRWSPRAAGSASSCRRRLPTSPACAAPRSRRKRDRRRRSGAARGAARAARSRRSCSATCARRSPTRPGSSARRRERRAEDVPVLEAGSRRWRSFEPYRRTTRLGRRGRARRCARRARRRARPGRRAVLDLVGFDGRLAGCDLAVTGEGRVDGTTREGKAPGVVAARCAAAGVRCVVFGGRVVEPSPAPRRSRCRATGAERRATSWSSEEASSGQSRRGREAAAFRDIRERNPR